MTKDEADEKVRKIEGEIGNFLAEYGGVLRGLLDKMQSRDDAITEGIRAAEAARAALDKPRLMTAEERVARVMKEYRTEKVVGECAVMVDRADILAQAEKLPKHTLIVPLHRGPGETDDFTIKYSDLRNLIQGT